MKLSILPNNEYLLWIASKKAIEVLDINENDARKLQAKTHRFDVEKKKVVEIPQPEPIPEPEPTDEELKEQKIKEAEALALRKMALQELWEPVDEIDTKIVEMKGILTEINNKITKK